MSIVMAIMLLITGCNQIIDKEKDIAIEPISKSEFVLGTIATVTLYEKVEVADKVFNEIFSYLKALEDKMSIKIETSEVSKLNEVSGIGEKVKVSSDVYTVIEKAIEIAELSQGGFDPTIGAVVQLWDIGGDHQRIPSEQEIADALATVDYKTVVFDKEQSAISLDTKGAVLDLGGIAKGFGADGIATILMDNGIKRGIIDLGGNVMVVGAKHNGQAFKVGIQDPLLDRGKYFGILQVSDKTVVSSGIYERYFEVEGKRYHHILDSKTGYPIDNELLAVSIIADSSMEADGLSTAAFSLGLSGVDFIENIEKVEGIFITKGREVYITSGLKDKFQLIDKRYTLIEE